MQSVELALVAAYNAASSLLTTPAAVETAVVFARHHNDHAEALGRVTTPRAGSTVPGSTVPGSGVANRALVGQFLAGLQTAKTEREALAVLYGLENDAAATQQYALEHLTTPAAIRQTASILPAEAQHSVVIGTLLQTDQKELVPTFQKHDGFLDPARYPVS